MHKARFETDYGDVRESLREFQILRDGRMTITLVCRTRLSVAATGSVCRLFAAVQPQRIIVVRDGERQETPVPGAV